MSDIHQMKKILLVFLFFPLLIFSQNKVTVHVENVKTSSGNIHIAVYNNAKGFLKFDHVLKSCTTEALKGTTVLVLNDLPSGTYAIAAFHDENINAKLDTNFIGIPKEQVGFSNSKMKTFGPPSFKECSFELDRDKDILITIK
tara:strand:+ start:22621 stop:23049 length:429 start_codon:yes stop_codon:yes gene_type:complete